MSLRAKWINGLLVYEDSVTFEAVRVVAPIFVKDDFINRVLADPWGTRDTNGASEALLGTTVAPNGLYQLLLANTNEVELAGIDYADYRPYRLDRGIVFEARVKFPTLPTGAVIACIGLCGNHNAAVDTVAESVWFRLDGSGAITVEHDDTVHETSKVATGVTLVANQETVLRIDLSDSTSVKFYVDGVRKASGTTFNMSQVAALTLQPVVRIGKESAAATVGEINVDYVTIWQKRS